ncbi:MAG: archease [Nanoarchaeota archaeon]
MKYKFIEDLTSDVMFEAYGKDLKELFQNAAEAMFSVICQMDKVRPKKSMEIEAEANSKEELMIAWLQELIAAVDTKEMFFSKFEITEIDEKHIKAKVYGEDADPTKGETVVKAVTYYKYKLEKTPKGFVTRVSLDI